MIKRIKHLFGFMALGTLSMMMPGAATAQTKASLDIADFGSFHVGGRLVEVQGKPVREVVFTPGGAPAKIDPNGKYMVESMSVQYFTPAKIKALRAHVAQERVAFGLADVVMAYGGNASLAAMQQQVPVTTRFLPHGHKLSFGMALLAAAINTFFGLLLAWALVQAWRGAVNCRARSPMLRTTSPPFSSALIFSVSTSALYASILAISPRMRRTIVALKLTALSFAGRRPRAFKIFALFSALVLRSFSASATVASCFSAASFLRRNSMASTNSRSVFTLTPPFLAKLSKTREKISTKVHFFSPASTEEEVWHK